MIRVVLVILAIFSVLILVLFSTTNFQKLTVVKKNNISKQPITLKANLYKDRYCNMTIKDINHSAQAILKNNDTLFFDDIGCLILWLETQKDKKNIVLWIFSHDTKKYINARDSWYLYGIKTPMHYNYVAYSKHIKNSISFNILKKIVLDTNKD
jgi:hypothetical protein